MNRFCDSLEPTKELLMANNVIIPYVFLGGRCEEAVRFYEKALGAKVEMLMRFRESPDPPPPGVVEPGFDDKILHCTLNIGGAKLMMSDGSHSGGTRRGFSLSLALPNEADARRAYDALAEAGSPHMPMGQTFWSPCFGMLTDQFGVAWMVSVVT
jgi:PhnB protein